MTFWDKVCELAQQDIDADIEMIDGIKTVLAHVKDYVRTHGRYPKRVRLEEEAWAPLLRDKMKRDDFRVFFERLQTYIGTAEERCLDMDTEPPQPSE